MTDKLVSEKVITTTRTGRSPAYPAFGLAFAIDKLQMFYKAQVKNAVGVEAAAESMGYQTARSGAAQRAIAALISYGLIAEEGSGASRKVKITEMGRKILLLPENDSEREDLIQEAATNPKIYKDMLAQWPENLPSEKELNKYLTFTKSYHEDIVPSLIKVFRETYEFAKLDKLEYHQTDDEDSTEVNEERGVQQNNTTSSSRNVVEAVATFERNNESAQRILHIPLIGGRLATLQTPATIDEEDYEFIRKYLEIFKDAIITKKSALQKSLPQIPEVPNVQTGSAIWHTKEHDLPVVVTGYLGEQEGRHYASTEGSTSGVPVDEIQYN